jgi:hypothetical protein
MISYTKYEIMFLMIDNNLTNGENKMIVQVQSNLKFRKSNYKNEKPSRDAKRNPNRFVSQRSRKKFPCRVITNPIELELMNYSTSTKINPVNDSAELLKKIA